jgi:hypothetical protein
MTLDSNGNFVLGTTSPLSASTGRTDLTINGASGGAIVSFGNGAVRKGYIYHDVTDFTISNDVAGAIRFLNNGSERARIDSSGNFGIGTSSPVAKLNVIGSANVSSLIVASASGITFSDATVQTTSAAPNITIIQGVDNTQNTQIATIQGVDNTQNTQIATIQGVDNTQNTQITIIQGVDVTQNTQITIIQGVDVTQNTQISSLQGGLNTANANIAFIIGVNNSQNTYAQAAFSKANNAGILAQAAFDKANTAPAASALTGSTLASGVTASSLTSVGTLLNLTVTNTITGSVSGSAGSATGNAKNITDYPLNQLVKTDSSVQFGSVTATGNITAYSDIRLKKNITKITYALDKVLQLNGYTFDRNDIETKRQTGVIAQEVLKVLPEAITGSEDTQYSVAYGNMMGLLIEAIKELKAEIEELKKGK